MVKMLGGFRKGHHTVPDAANAVTNAFLGKLCAGELAEEAERLFQDARTGLGYKRKDITLTIASPLATLVARDFAVDIFYALEERNPAQYAVTTTLRDLGDLRLARSDGLARLFAARFTEISFALKQGARVEAVIDAIEALDGVGGLVVAYPSDCSTCSIRVQGVEAEVRMTGATLEVVFPRRGGPNELIEAFALVREAFQVSKDLQGLIG